jgi:putative ABC transport system permease protein
MFDRDKWAEVFQVLGKNPLRTIATAFGVVWGIMMLIIMIGSGNGLQNGVQGNMQRVTNHMSVWSQTTTKAYGGFNRGRRFSLDISDIDYLKQNIPEMDIITPRGQMGGYRGSENVVRGIKTGAYTVHGDTPDFIKIESKLITQGRFLNWGDLEAVRKVCVIGETVYRELFEKGEDPIGEYIEIGGVNMQVIGMYKSQLMGEAAEEDTKTIYIPVTVWQKIANSGSSIGWMSMTTKPGYSVAEMEEKVLAALRKRHKIHPEDTRALGSYNAERRFNEMNAVFGGIRTLSWFVGVLTLFAGIVGVSNIMLVIIKERTREIGVRKAMGATPFAIVSQVLLESLFLSAIAGFVGVIFGVWLLELVSLYTTSDSGSFKNPGVDINVIIGALAVLIVSGLFAGLIPAIRAVSIKPVDALRAE